jgi:hypothetical protein
MSDKTVNGGPTATRAILVALIVLAILFPLGYSIIGRVIAHAEPAEVFLERPDAKYKECVRETEFMRYHHWELLRAIREEVVRYGYREDIGLKKCGECHTSRERFCDACHNAVSMTPDCWGCHYYP